MRVGDISLSQQPEQPAGRSTRSGVRNVITTLVFFASLAAWVLVVHDQQARQRPGPAEGQESSLDIVSPAGAKTKPGQQTALSAAEESRYRALSGFVAKRYRVSQEVAFDLVSVAHATGRQLGLDPLLIIAVIAIESRFNPIAESVAGAKGLMQIIPKYHADKLEEFGGQNAVYDPEANIQIGSQILKEYIRYTGNLGSALQMYAGALGDSQDQYTRKVLNEKQRLQGALSPVLKRPAPATAVRTAAVPYSASAGLELD